MKGDIVLLVTGRPPCVAFERLPSAAAARRRKRATESAGPKVRANFYLIDPETRRVRSEKTKLLTTMRLPESVSV